LIFVQELRSEWLGAFDLLDVLTRAVHSPDIFAIGFQEIVPLTAQQIVQTDPEKRQALLVLLGLAY
jgi:hypothetical protein